MVSSNAPATYPIFRASLGFPDVSAVLEYHHRRYGFLLQRSSQVFASLFAQERRFEGPNLSLSQLEILCAVAFAPGMHQSLLSARLGMDTATLGLSVNQLEQAGYVERRPTHDGRKKVIYPRIEGCEVATQGLACADRTTERFFRPIGASRAKQLVLLLAEIVERWGMSPTWATLQSGNAPPFPTDPNVPFLPASLAPSFLIDQCIAIYLQAVIPALRGMNPYHYAALFLITTLSPIDQAGLARALGVERPSASQFVKFLLARSWIERSPDSNDARRLLLRATEKGAAHIGALKPDVEAADATFLDRIAASKRKRFVDIFHELLVAHHALVVPR
jgi:DNA-binding MarR family transcriptional regulator